MTQFAPEWVAQQRRRFLRHDAHRFLRYDWERFVKPGGESPWPLSALVEAKANFDPGQTRVPAGHPDGGQWTDKQGAVVETTDDIAIDPSGFEDAITEFSASRARGHHFLPRALYKDMPLARETRKVFDDATTGPIGLRARSEGGVLSGYFWDGAKGAHGLYNDAVKELMNSFLETNRITPESMNPDQARALIEKIKISEDPRIRDYLNSIRILQYLRRLPIGGRGSE
jgi:hypothetical protein